MNALLAATAGVEVPVTLLVAVIGICITGLITLFAWLTKQMIELSRANSVLATKNEQLSDIVAALTSRVEALVAQVRQLEIYGMQWKTKGND